MTTQETVAAPMPRRLGFRGFFKNLLYWILDLDDEVTLEQGRARLRNSPGFFASLTPDQMAMIRNYDGSENFGPPLTKRERHDLERRLSSQN